MSMHSESSAAQWVEHYEITGYGTARTYAEILGDNHVAKLLQTTLAEGRSNRREINQIGKVIYQTSMLRTFLARLNLSFGNL